MDKTVAMTLKTYSSGIYVDSISRQSILINHWQPQWHSAYHSDIFAWKHGPCLSSHLPPCKLLENKHNPFLLDTRWMQVQVGKKVSPLETTNPVHCTQTFGHPASSFTVMTILWLITLMSCATSCMCNTLHNISRKLALKCYSCVPPQILTGSIVYKVWRVCIWASSKWIFLFCFDFLITRIIFTKLQHNDPFLQCFKMIYGDLKAICLDAETNCSVGKPRKPPKRRY